MGVKINGHSGQNSRLARTHTALAGVVPQSEESVPICTVCLATLSVPLFLASPGNPDWEERDRREKGRKTAKKTGKPGRWLDAAVRSEGFSATEGRMAVTSRLQPVMRKTAGRGSFMSGQLTKTKKRNQRERERERESWLFAQSRTKKELKEQRESWFLAANKE